MNRWLIGLLALFVASCSGALASSDQRIQGDDSAAYPAGTSPAEAKLPPRADIQLENFGPAPELTNEVWLNTDQPPRLAGLRGKVVLLEMWTFS